jgi:enoyl-CoA hydratase
MPRVRSEPPVLFAKDAAVAVVTLNRPHVLNAYNVAMRDALYEALTAVRDDPEVRAVVLQGNGQAFCTGGDVREFGSAPSPVVARQVRWQRDVWGLLCSMTKPVVAAVHGYVVGGGLEMALLCDVCIAARNARFAYPESGLGMIPGVGGTQTTPRAIGVGRALDLILTGRWLDASTAARLGLVAQIVSSRELRARAFALARELCKVPPILMQRMKRAINEGLDVSLAQGLALEQQLFRLPVDSTSEPIDALPRSLNGPMKP